MSDIEDLTRISHVSEGSVLEILRERYLLGKTFTFTGDILLSFNPYRARTAESLGPNHESTLGDGFHIPYKIPAQPRSVAFFMVSGLSQSRQKQCCVMSGDSGSGKSENVKSIIAGLGSIGGSQNFDLSLFDKAYEIVDSFGNAQTSLCENASRLSKLFELYGAETGQIIGANISTYLLERGRVTNVKKDGRNFHIFYYLLSGLEEHEASKYFLLPTDEFRYLKQVDIFKSVEQVEVWKEKFNSLRDNLAALSFTPEDFNFLFTILSAILIMGNIKFGTISNVEGVTVLNKDSLGKVATLLGLCSRDLEQALIKNSLSVNGETVSNARSLLRANESRDRMAQALYSRLFGWLMHKTNAALLPAGGKKRKEESLSYMILDIFGFEQLEQNRFDQLCINAANEQLQFYFAQRVFAWEEVEYETEGIVAPHLSYMDNKSVINLLLEKPVGIFTLLDEESKYPQADDQTLASKLNANCNGHPSYLSLNSKLPTFGVRHYAKEVIYLADGFLEKNRDSLNSNITECLKELEGKLSNRKGSSKEMVCVLFYSQLSRTGSLNLRLRKSGSSTRTGTKSKQKGPLTVSTLLRNSLVDFMEKVLPAQSYFIRCHHPNQEGNPSFFDEEFVKEQLRRNGILEIVRAKQLGYPIRMPFAQLLNRYRYIAFPMLAKLESTAENCDRILTTADLTDWKIGVSKVFLRSEHIEQLERRLEKVTQDVITTQRIVRGKLARVDYEYLLSNKRHEERTVGNFLLSISTKSFKMNKALETQNLHDQQRDKSSVEGLNKKKTKENRRQDMRRSGHRQTENFKRLKRVEDDSKLVIHSSGNRMGQNEFPILKDFCEKGEEPWCRVDCFERQFHVGTFLLHQQVITVDGSVFLDSSARIGLGAIPSITQDNKVIKVKSCIGKGLKVHQDEDGNLWATRMGKNDVFLRGYTLSPELVRLNGKLTQGVPMKVFDAAMFRNQLDQDCADADNFTDETKTRLLAMCKICASFIKDTVVDEDTPCWVEFWLLQEMETVKRRTNYLLGHQTKRRDPKDLSTIPVTKQPDPLLERNSNIMPPEKDEDCDTYTFRDRGNVTEGAQEVQETTQGPRGSDERMRETELPLYQTVYGPNDSTAYDVYGIYYRAESEEGPSSSTRQPFSNDPMEGLSYRQVFGIQGPADYFSFAPPTYRQRRYSDSDSESVRSYIQAGLTHHHGLIGTEIEKIDRIEKSIQPAANANKKWASKRVRRKSEDQRRKVTALR